MKKLFSVLFLSLALNLAGHEIENWSSPPVSISTSGVNASDPRMGMDANGTAVALWLENDALVSRTLPEGGSWSASSTLASSAASAPQIVVDQAGNATAVWIESNIVRTATKPFGSSWSSSSALSSSGSSSPQIAVDPSGDVVAVWVTSGVVQSATKLFGMSWSGTPTVLSSSASAAPQVAIGPDGTVVATWHTLNATTSVYNVNSAKKAIAGSWSTATLVSNPSENSVYPQIAVDSNGIAIAIWFSYNLVGEQYLDVMLQSATWPATGSWSTPTSIPPGGTLNPSHLMATVSFSNGGEAIALWTTNNNASYIVNASQTTDRINWSQAYTLSYDLYSYALDVAINSANNAFSVFMTTDPNTGYVAIYTTESDAGNISGGSWSDPVILSGPQINGYPQIAAAVLDGVNAYAVATWANYDGSNNNIQTIIGTGNLVTPPTNLSVTQTNTNFGIFQEYFNTLTWTESLDPNLLNYAVTRNGILVAYVSPGSPQYIDYNQDLNGPVTYGVTAVNIHGNLSLTVPIAFP